jgi:hypothetical protein
LNILIKVSDSSEKLPGAFCYESGSRGYADMVLYEMPSPASPSDFHIDPLLPKSELAENFQREEQLQRGEDFAKNPQSCSDNCLSLEIPDGQTYKFRQCFGSDCSKDEKEKSLPSMEFTECFQRTQAFQVRRNFLENSRKSKFKKKFASETLALTHG